MNKLLENYLTVLEQGDEGIAAFREATKSIAEDSTEIYRGCMPECKKHLGFIKAFKEKERHAYAVCDAKCRLKAAKHAVSLLNAASKKCNGNERCLRMVKADIDRINDYIDRLEMALENAIKNAKK